MDFTILGAGAWGTAMAVSLSRMGHGVHLVSRRMEHALDVASDRENKAYLPGISLNKNIQIGCELVPALMECDVVILACPSKALPDLLDQVSRCLSSAWRLKAFLSLSKGIAEGTYQTPVEVMQQVLPDYAHGVLTGPSYAREVAQGKPAAVVLAGTGDLAYWQHLQTQLSGDSLRVYFSEDVRGVELGSCLKNVYAIAMGICQGLRLGDNAAAALLTRSLHEMVRLGVLLGGQVESFYGLSGFGDLMATCTGAWSRNRTFGEAIGEGTSIDELLKQKGGVVEGYRAARCFYEWCQREKIDMPILEQVYAVLYQGREASVTIENLMARELKVE